MSKGRSGSYWRGSEFRVDLHESGFGFRSLGRRAEDLHGLVTVTEGTMGTGVTGWVYEHLGSVFSTCDTRFLQQKQLHFIQFALDRYHQSLTPYQRCQS